MSTPLPNACGFQSVAHRGWKSRYPENTLLAFQKAYEAGATMIELDVRLSADGEVIILHDPDLKRISGDTRQVSSVTWQELSTLSVHCPDARDVQEGRLSRLEELFQHFGARLYYYIEVKHSESEANEYHYTLCQEVMNLVKSYGLERNTLYVSFEAHLLEWLRERLPDASLAWNVKSPEALESHAPRILELRAELCPHDALCTEKSIATWKERGHQVLPWVVNERERMLQLIRWGVDGITTDDIGVLMDLIWQDPSLGLNLCTL